MLAAKISLVMAENGLLTGACFAALAWCLIGLFGKAVAGTASKHFL